MTILIVTPGHSLDQDESKDTSLVEISLVIQYVRGNKHSYIACEIQ